MMTPKIFTALASVTGMSASVIGGIPTDPGTIEAVGKWPLTIVLGMVCVISIYIGYLSSKEAAVRTLRMIEGERLATEKTALSTTNAAKELAVESAKALKDVATDSAKALKELATDSAKALREVAEAHAKEVRTLLDEVVKKKE
jgi:hypothetical protein